MHFHVELNVKCLSCMCVINMIVHKIALSHIYEFYHFFSVVAILVVMCKGKAGMVIWLDLRCRLAYGPADATATHCLLLL